jgi:galactitol PTS system EIIA component
MSSSIGFSSAQRQDTPDALNTRERVELRSLLVDDLIRVSFSAATWEDVLRRLAADLYAAGRVRAAYEDAVVARERTFPTGLEVNGVGVAIPHADIEHVVAPAVAVATLAAPVAFGEMGNPQSSVQVSVVCMLAIHRADAVVGLLKELVQCFQQPGVLRAAVAASSPEAVRTVFTQSLATQAAHESEASSGASGAA